VNISRYKQKGNRGKKKENVGVYTFHGRDQLLKKNIAKNPYKNKGISVQVSSHYSCLVYLMLLFLLI